MDGLIGYLLAKAKAKKYTDQVAAGIGSGFNYKGSVATVADLPTTGVSNGDEYTVTDGSGAYAYNGTSWDKVAQRGETGEQGATGATGPAGQNGRTYDVKVNSTSVLDSDMIAQLQVIDNVTSTSANTPLSAHMGKELQDEINNLKNIGRFLAIWNCVTGLPLTNPTTSPYTYKTGDYFRVGVVATGGTTNYMPNGSSFTIGVASSTVETGDVEVGWVYYYDGTNWLAQSAGGGGTVQDVQINGTTILDSGSGVANIPLATTSDNGAMSTAQVTTLNNAILDTAQSLTTAQQTQARTNIGAYTVQTGTSAPSSLDTGVIYFVVED